MAIERPRYTIELSEEPLEVRDYAPTIVATVHVAGDRSDAVSAGFRLLAGYIFGDNQAHGKIAMTAPVTQNVALTIPTTTPAEQKSVLSGWDVQFTMPAAYTLSTLPKPADSRISLVQLPARRVASITFSGFWSDSNFQLHQLQLLEFIKKHQLTTVSEPIYAYYNAPWTPWFMRTNEVLVEISAARP